MCLSAIGQRGPEDLDAAVRDWLAQPAALLDVMTSRMELVMPPHIEVAPVFGMALYSAKAVLAGRAGCGGKAASVTVPRRRSSASLSARSSVSSGGKSSPPSALRWPRSVASPESPAAPP